MESLDFIVQFFTLSLLPTTLILQSQTKACTHYSRDRMILFHETKEGDKSIKSYTRLHYLEENIVLYSFIYQPTIYTNNFVEFCAFFSKIFLSLKQQVAGLSVCLFVCSQTLGKRLHQSSLNHQGKFNLCLVEVGFRLRSDIHLYSR